MNINTGPVNNIGINTDDRVIAKNNFYDYQYQYYTTTNKKRLIYHYQ